MNVGRGVGMMFSEFETRNLEVQGIDGGASRDIVSRWWARHRLTSAITKSSSSSRVLSVSPMGLARTNMTRCVRFLQEWPTVRSLSKTNERLDSERNGFGKLHRHQQIPWDTFI